MMGSPSDVPEIHGLVDEVARLRAKLVIVERIARHGVGPDTTADEALETIAHYARAALDRHAQAVDE